MFQESLRQAPANSLISPTLTFNSAHPQRHPQRQRKVCFQTCALQHEPSAWPLLPTPQAGACFPAPFQTGARQNSWSQMNVGSTQATAPVIQSEALMGTHQSAPAPCWCRKTQLAPHQIKQWHLCTALRQRGSHRHQAEKWKRKIIWLCRACSALCQHELPTHCSASPHPDDG